MPGCSARPQELLYPVKGIVRQGDKPLGTGVVSLRPDSQQGKPNWHHPTGAIDREGRYEVFTAGRAGAPPGKYKAVVFANEEFDKTGVHPGLPKSIIDTRFQSEQTTPLSLEVVESPTEGAYDLQLGPEKGGPPG